MASNVGRIIQSNYCEGFAGNDFNLSGARIEAEADDYIVIRTTEGVPIFIGFFTFDKGEMYKDGWHYKDKEEMIDKWCGT